MSVDGNDTSRDVLVVYTTTPLWRLSDDFKDPCFTSFIAPFKVMCRISGPSQLSSEAVVTV